MKRGCFARALFFSFGGFQRMSMGFVATGCGPFVVRGLVTFDGFFVAFAGFFMVCRRCRMAMAKRLGFCAGGVFTVFTAGVLHKNPI
jgi:hypothetical protein